MTYVQKVFGDFDFGKGMGDEVGIFMEFEEEGGGQKNMKKFPPSLYFRRYICFMCI